MDYEFKLLKQIKCLILITIMLCAGCQPSTDHYNGKSAHYIDPVAKDEVSGVGIDSQDIIFMTDEMIVDILRDSRFLKPEKPPAIVIDAIYFENRGSTRIDKNLITDRLRVELNRAARGKMLFVGREYLGMVLNELELKQTGVIPEEGDAQPRVLKADYRLGGRISTLDSINPKTACFSRYHQILFEMVDLVSGEIVWSGIYSFKKTAQEDIIYR